MISVRFNVVKGRKMKNGQDNVKKNLAKGRQYF